MFSGETLSKFPNSWPAIHYPGMFFFLEKSKTENKWRVNYMSSAGEDNNFPLILIFIDHVCFCNLRYFHSTHLSIFFQRTLVLSLATASRFSTSWTYSWTRTRYPLSWQRNTDYSSLSWLSRSFVLSLVFWCSTWQTKLAWMGLKDKNELQSRISVLG